MKKSLSRPKRAVPSEAPQGRSETDRRLRQADRLARILRLLQLLLSRGRWTRKDLALAQECSERTVYRDLQVLELAGIPIQLEPAGLYRIRHDFRFPSLPLSDDEALGQAVASVIAAGPGLDVTAGAAPVTKKIVATAGDELARVMHDAQQLILVLDLKLADHSRHREILRTIQWGLIHRKQLSGSYRSPYEERAVKLQLHPYRLCLIKQAWYLIAANREDATPRTYRVARFRTLRQLEASAKVPDSFDLKSYLGNAWSVFRGETSYKIEVHFAKAAARLVTEGVWHSTQKIQKHPDGSVTLRFTVDGLQEILRWILGWGAHAAVIQPPKLRQLVREQLEHTLRIYQP